MRGSSTSPAKTVAACGDRLICDRIQTGESGRVVRVVQDFPWPTGLTNPVEVFPEVDVIRSSHHEGIGMKEQSPSIFWMPVSCTAGYAIYKLIMPH